ncbi:hypothetical protein GCM10011351_12500 [Paraliobacillus quinghaiensis]|uniref:HemX protein n=1 Tax=Paraliobacillus quinghaiensis TaxID=470815 RepID=A0A917TMZ1_9BACI|nr:DUF4023 domain-containing protein [Paraliobacillus quinghaiensis]GGM28111.1 hypothetical protein GCM10011351_12500 [Paraliobacillus quinghaiensis]
MDSTHDFVKKFNENQKKAERNKKNQGNGRPSNKLPSKKHNDSNS